MKVIHLPMLRWFNLFLCWTEPFQLYKTNLGRWGEEIVPLHFALRKLSLMLFIMNLVLSRAYWGRGACFVFADSANYTLRELFRESRVLYYVRHCQVIWQIPPWDALSDRLRESWTGQLPAEKLNLNTFKILWWPICGFGSRKKEDEK